MGSHHLAIRAHRCAQEIAPHTGREWRYEVDDGDDLPFVAVIHYRPQGLMTAYGLGIEALRNGYLLIHGLAPVDVTPSGGVTSWCVAVEGPSIRVNAYRRAVDIAGDIKRRLLPEYDEYYTGKLTELICAAQTRARSAAILEKAAKIAGVRPRWNALNWRRDNTWFQFRVDGRSSYLTIQAPLEEGLDIMQKLWRVTMRFTVDKPAFRKAVRYFVENEQGLSPVLDSDDDLVEWGFAAVNAAAPTEDSDIEVVIHGDVVAICVPSLDVAKELRLRFL